jgi:hypothetical protein
MDHKEIMKAFEQRNGLKPEHTEKISKVKAKVEILGDYADTEKAFRKLSLLRSA